METFVRHFILIFSQGALTSFKFIITPIVTVRALFFMRGITEKMQGRSLDIYDVVLQVRLL